MPALRVAAVRDGDPGQVEREAGRASTITNVPEGADWSAVRTPGGHRGRVSGR